MDGQKLIENMYDYEEGKRLVQSTFDYFFEPDARPTAIMETKISKEGEKTFGDVPRLLQMSHEEFLRKINDPKEGYELSHFYCRSNKNSRVLNVCYVKDGEALIGEYVGVLTRLGSFKVWKDVNGRDRAEQISDRDAMQILNSMNGQYRFKRKVSNEEGTVAEHYFKKAEDVGVAFLYGKTRR